MAPCDEPLRCSWSGAFTSNVAVLFIPSDSQESFPFAAVLVEVITVGIHSLLDAKSNFCFSISSLVTHFVCVVVRLCEAELAFILSSKRARCSGLNLSSMLAGIGSPPSTLELIVVSQRPGLMFKGTRARLTLPSGNVFPKSGFWGFCWANIAVATTIIRTETIAPTRNCFPQFDDCIFPPEIHGVTSRPLKRWAALDCRLPPDREKVKGNAD